MITQNTSQVQGSITIKLIKQVPTAKELLKSQIQHYTDLLTHPKFESRSMARQQLFNLKKIA